MSASKIAYILYVFAKQFFGLEDIQLLPITMMNVLQEEDESFEDIPSDLELALSTLIKSNVFFMLRHETELNRRSLGIERKFHKLYQYEVNRRSFGNEGKFHKR